MKCKYCHMPVNEPSRGITRAEAKYLERDIPMMVGEMKKINSKLDNIVELPEDEKMKLEKFVSSIPSRFPGRGILNSDFSKTTMGRRFFEVFMPNLIKELARLNKNLETLIELKRKD